MTEELLTRQELAKALKLSTKQIQRLEEEGLPYVQFGKRSKRYDLDRVIAWKQEKQELAKDIN